MTFLKILLISPYYYCFSQFVFFLRFERLNLPFSVLDISLFIVGFYSVYALHKIEKNSATISYFLLAFIFSNLFFISGGLIHFIAAIVLGMLPFYILLVSYKIKG